MNASERQSPNQEDDQPQSVEPKATRAPEGGGVAWQGILALLDQGVASATTFLTLLIVARTLTEDELGIYSLCLSLALFAAMVQERTLPMPYMVFCHDTAELRPARLLGSVLLHQQLLAVISTALVLGYSVYLLASESLSAMTTGTLALCAAMIPFMLRDFLRSICFAKFQLQQALVLDVVVMILQLGGLLALSSSGTLSVTTSFVAIAVACAAGSLSWWLLFRPQIEISLASAKSTWSKHWRFSRWLVYGRLIGQGCQLVMPWIVAAMLNRAAAGELSVCATLAGLSWVFVRGLNNLLQPRAVRAFNQGGKSGLIRETLGSSLVYGVILGCMLLVFVLAGPWLLAIFKPKFSDASMVLVILGLNTLVTSLALTCSNGLNAMQLSQANFKGEVATGVSTLLAAYPMISWFGIAGAAGAMLTGAVACLLTMGWVFFNELRRVDTN